MKTILNLILLALIISITCACCAKQPNPKEKTKADEYELALLFEMDGCKVYRFYDKDYYRYFTNCKGEVAWHQLNGKVNKEFTIPTDLTVDTMYTDTISNGF